MARMPPGDSYGYGAGTDLDDIPQPPVARWPGGFDGGDDDDYVPEAAPPDFGAPPTIAAPKPPPMSTRPSPPVKKPVPDGAPPSSMFLPPARMPVPTSPMRAAGAGSVTGLHIGGASPGKGRPKHLPPALAPRPGSWGTRSSPAARGTSGTDPLSDDGGMAYDDADHIAGVNPSMRALVPTSVLPPSPPVPPTVPMPRPPPPRPMEFGDADDDFNFGGREPREPQLKKR